MPLVAKIEFMPIADINSLPVMDLADEYPTIEGDELNDLITSIEANGIREALVLFDGTLLDGRNRLAVANKVKLEEVPVRYFVGTIEEAEDLIVDLNEKRRHLLPVQRAYIADKHRAIVAKRAAERLALGAKKTNEARWGTESPMPEEGMSDGIQESGPTREILAKKHNAGKNAIDTVQRIRRVAEERMTDPDSEGEVLTPRALKATSVLTKMKKGTITMVDAQRSVFGDPGQVTSVDDPVSKAKVAMNKMLNDLFNGYKLHADVLLEFGNAADCENVRIKTTKLFSFAGRMNDEYGGLECEDLVDTDENREYWDVLEEEAEEHGARHLATEAIDTNLTKPCGCDFSGREECDECQ